MARPDGRPKSLKVKWKLRKLKIKRIVLSTTADDAGDTENNENQIKLKQYQHNNRKRQKLQRNFHTNGIIFLQSTFTIL